MATLLDRAQKLLNKESLTIEDVRELERIEAQASGEEAEMIGELWSTVYAMADETLLAQLQD